MTCFEINLAIGPPAVQGADEHFPCSLCVSVLHSFTASVFTVFSSRENKERERERVWKKERKSGTN